MTLINDTSILITGIVIAVLLFLLERFILKRGHIKLISHRLANIPTKKGDSVSIVFEYQSNAPLLPYSKIRGRLVDKAAPTTVIELEPRSLAFMPQGAERRVGFINRRSSQCQEYLHFPIKPFLQSGDEEWELHLEVITIGCYVNPFYKIFPIIARLRGDISIKQPRR